MATRAQVEVIITMKVSIAVDVAVSSTAETDSTTSGQIVVGVGVRGQDAAANRQNGAVGRGNVEEVEVVRVADVEVAVAAVHRVLGTEGVRADLQTDLSVEVHHQTHGSDRSRRSVEWTSKLKVSHPLLLTY